MTGYSESAFAAGRTCAAAIRENIGSLFISAKRLGFTEDEVLKSALERLPEIPEERSGFIGAMAEGAGVDFTRLLAYNLFQQSFQPEGCTVFFAAPDSSKSGNVIIGKNSDKGGSPELVGEGFYDFHEINVVSYFENRDGSHVVGVSAAGTTGLKIGMNSHGVCVTTNYGYTAMAANRPLTVKDNHAGDRAQIARDGLQFDTALKAAQYAAQELMAHPMASSGMITYADAREIYAIENAYEYVAVKKITEGVDSRSNYLVLLDYLNNPGNASCYCRYHRSQELMKEMKGRADFESMKKVSMDHKDGTGTLGICRHVDGFPSSTQAAAIMEPDREHPEKSVIHIALGRPCNAWREEDGHISVTMDMKREDIPEFFLSGGAYIKYYNAAPREE